MSKKTSFTKEQQEYIKKSYGVISYVEMSKKLKRNPSSIRSLARKILDVTPKSKMGKSKFGGRKAYSVDINFFEKFSVLNCYYAGFIAADGCIYEKNDNNKSLIIKLAAKDKCHLEELKKNIQYAGNINLNSFKYEYKGVKSFKETCRLKINNVKIVDDLAKNFGIYPNKTFDITFPIKLKNKKHIDAFILGYIDGDGCTNESSGKPRLNILGNNKLLSGIAKRFEQVIGKGIKVKVTIKQKNNKISKIEICGDSARKILSHYYRISLHLPCLKRKWKSGFEKFNLSN